MERVFLPRVPPGVQSQDLKTYFSQYGREVAIAPPTPGSPHAAVAQEADLPLHPPGRDILGLDLVP